LTEELLQAAFPGTRNYDAGIGSDVILAEVVWATGKAATREQADVTSSARTLRRSC